MSVLSILSANASSIVVGAVALALGYWFFGRRQKNLPPGPTPIPVLGNLLSVSKFKSTAEALTHYQKQYGNIFTIYMGSSRAVVLCGNEMIREGLISNADSLSDRPNHMTSPNIFSYNGKGVINDNENWKHNRKFTLHALRDFGFGKKSIDERVYEEAEQFCDYLATMEGQAVDIKMHLMKAFSNVICTIVFGDRFEYNDERFNNLLKLLDFLFARMGSESAILDNMPWLVHFPYFRSQHKTFVKANMDVDKCIQDIIEEHKLTFDPENVRDFIDLYLKSDPSNERTAMVIIKELFFAGTETSGTTMSWAFLILAKYPEIQRKCREEIKKVIGSGRGPKTSDRGSLPYTEATLHEIQRFRSIAPLALPHAVRNDTRLAGYDLPKGTVIMPYLDSAHHDPNVWPDHDEFKPERWLDQAGKFDPKSPAFMPFSVGRRACLGEQLAKVELFIIFVAVLQQFEFSPEPGTEVSLDGNLGVSFAPANGKLVCRKKEV